MTPAARFAGFGLTLWAVLAPLHGQDPVTPPNPEADPPSPAPERIPLSVLPHRDEWPLLQKGLEEALALHTELLDAAGTSAPPATLLARASRAFLAVAPAALSDRGRSAPSAAFLLADEDFLRLLAATPHPPVAAFAAFSGKWFGLWEGLPVDHDWSETAPFDPPLTLSHPSLDLHALQYAWIGDGFGWNILVSQPDEPTRKFILGSVYHVRDRDRKKIYLHRPHAGIAPDPRTLVWITRNEVFFEEVPEVPANRERYFIHGFFYARDGAALGFPRGGFSAAYGRDPDNRLPWLPLPFDPGDRSGNP